MPAHGETVNHRESFWVYGPPLEESIFTLVAEYGQAAYKAQSSVGLPGLNLSRKI